jgi:GntR family transcriptional regulator
MKQIEHGSPVPYYHQLADILREEIDRGRWNVNELIPAEGALNDMFGVSRSVTRKALELLENEGRVLRIKGKGTLVVQPKFTYEASSAAGQWFSQRTEIVRLGSVISAGRVTSGGNLGRILGISPRDDVWELVFTHTLGGEPASVSQMFLLILGTLTVSAPPEFEPGGADILTQLTTRYGVDVVTSQMEVESGRASSFEADQLGIEGGAPVIQVNSLDSSENRTVGFTRTVIRPEHFFLAMELTRKRGITGQGRLAELLARSNDGSAPG